MGKRVCPSYWKVDEERSSWWRIYLVYSGKVTYWGSEGTFDLERDTLYVFPSDKAYKMRHDAQDPLYCCWFHILLQPPLIAPLLKIPLGKGLVQQLARTLDMATLEEAPEQVIVCLLESLIYFLADEYDLEFIVDERLAPVLDYIHRNYADELRSNDLARLTGYSASHLCRLFKLLYGTTLYQYIQGIRLTQSRLLLSKGIAIADVAASVGYDDAKAFSRAFFRRFSEAPSAYRKRCSFLQP